MSASVWFILVVSVMLVYFAVAKQTGFKILTQGAIPSWVQKLFTATPDGDTEVWGYIKKWWDDIDKPASPGKQIVTIIAALLLAYIEFSIHGKVWIALITILIAAVIAPPKGLLTRAFLVFDLVVIILASFFPGAQMIRGTSFDIADTWFKQRAVEMENFAKDYKSGKAELFAFSKNKKEPATATKTAHVTATAEDYTWVRIPPQSTLEKFACPSGVIMAVVHQGDPAGQTYDCDTDTVALNVNGVIDLMLGFKSKTSMPISFQLSIR